MKRYGNLGILKQSTIESRAFYTLAYLQTIIFTL